MFLLDFIGFYSNFVVFEWIVFFSRKKFEIRKKTEEYSTQRERRNWKSVEENGIYEGKDLMLMKKGFV